MVIGVAENPFFFLFKRNFNQGLHLILYTHHTPSYEVRKHGVHASACKIIWPDNLNVIKVKSPRPPPPTHTHTPQHACMHSHSYSIWLNCWCCIMIHQTDNLLLCSDSKLDKWFIKLKFTKDSENIVNLPITYNVLKIWNAKCLEKNFGAECLK